MAESPARMPAESPPMSPLSHPPSWFRDEDTECPHSDGAREPSPSMSPFSPPPSWFNDSDVECPPFRGSRRKFGRKPCLGEGGEQSSALKRPFEWLDSGDEITTKRTCSGDDKPANISDIASQEGNEGVFTVANEASTPLSGPSECVHDDQLATVKPEVWANLRGGLCEALPYFRAYKGSLQTQGKTAMGFLVDKEASISDVFGSQIIISSVGGGRVRDEETNKMIRREDAPEKAMNINAIREAHECRGLVAVVAGEDHPLYPCKPPHPYAVLDWFHITDIWGEMHVTKKGRRPVRIWRIRLEKAHLAKPAWWTCHADGGVASPPDPEIRAPSRGCSECPKQSKQIFTAGWTCLNHECSSFFQFPSIGAGLDVNTLAYTDAFLNERSPFIGPLPNLKPEIPNFSGFHGTEKLLRRGFVCPECGYCSRRIYWNWFFCENCPYRLKSVMLPYPDDILAQEELIFDEKMACRRKQKKIKIVVVKRTPEDLDTQETNVDVNIDEHDSGDGEINDISTVPEESQMDTKPEDVNETSAFVKAVKGDEPFSTTLNPDIIKMTQTLVAGPYRVRQYFLPGPDGNIIGSFALFIFNPDINLAPNGPNDMFRQLELTDIGLKRNPAAIPGHKLEGLTRHFQQNFGARYKFGVSVRSKGFDEAPDVVLRALHRLAWAGTHAATTARLDGYDLGPDGPPPTSNDFNELLALGYMEDDRINYHDDGESELGPTVAALSLGSPSTMKFRPKLKSSFGNSLPKKSAGKAFVDVLKVPMKHGDMMVMHGGAIHRYMSMPSNPWGVIGSP